MPHDLCIAVQRVGEFIDVGPQYATHIPGPTATPATHTENGLTLPFTVWAIELVGYITRKDSGAMPSDPAQFGYEIGTTSAIRDYEELDKLYELYDEADEENEDFYYEKLQLKKRKVIGEVVKIFGDDGAAFARTATEELSYAYQVVEEMVEKHNVDNETDYDFNTYFKAVFFDYETLVYFLAFEETVALNKSTFAATNRKNITTLYGYYYQYEKADYECMTDAQYKEYLKLSTKDEKNDAEALKYTEYDRTHYAKAYRYSSKCYERYYTEHFQFQARQEKYDKTVYTGGSVINGKEVLPVSCRKEARGEAKA